MKIKANRFREIVMSAQEEPDLQHFLVAYGLPLWILEEITDNEQAAVEMIIQIHSVANMTPQDVKKYPQIESMIKDLQTNYSFSKYPKLNYELSKVHNYQTMMLYLPQVAMIFKQNESEIYDNICRCYLEKLANQFEGEEKENIVKVLH